MLVKDIGFLLVDNRRSRAYVQKLVRNSLLPELAVVFEKEGRGTPRFQDGELGRVADVIRAAFEERKYFLYDPDHSRNAVDGVEYRRPEKYASFDIDEPVLQTLATNGIETLRVRAPSINDERVVRAVRAGAPSYFIFGGGGILRKEMLSTGKRFIHVHPGDLPGFRGSHCIEWAVLERARCAASAIFMSEAIDEGDLIARRRFPRPELENNAIAPLYSAHIRSELLVQVVSRFAKEGRFQAKKQPAGGQTYYKMHPALTNLVFHELLGAGERE